MTTCTDCNKPITNPHDQITIQRNGNTIGTYHRRCHNQRRRDLSG